MPPLTPPAELPDAEPPSALPEKPDNRFRKGALPASVHFSAKTVELLRKERGDDAIGEAIELASFSETHPTDEQPDVPVGKMTQLLERLADPVLGQQDLVANMRACGVKIYELMEALQKRDVALALIRSSRRMGAVLDGVGEFAEPQQIPCRLCNATGGQTITDDDGNDTTVLCSDCMGTGQLRRMGDIDAIKVYLATHGLAGKGAGNAGGGTVVNVNAQAAAGIKTSSNKDEEPITARVQRIIEV